MRTPRALIMVLLLCSLILTGCNQIPRTGAVVQAQEASTRASSAVEVAPLPPPHNASRREVVEGFMQAMASYEPDYITARMYLTQEAAAEWSPSEQISVYANGYPLTDVDGHVLLNAPITGRVDAQGSYQAVEESIETDFGLERNAEGQWRITHPPSGLLVSQFVFDNFFQPVQLYWAEPTEGFLVPDPIFMPSGKKSPTTLIEALLEGPSDWIAPAVHTVIPAGTTLADEVSVDDDGVATVDLHGDLAGLDQAQRRLMIGQLVWTLRDLPEISGVRVLHEGAPYETEVSGDNDVVPITALPQVDPIPGNLDNQLFALIGGSVNEVQYTDQGVTAQQVVGDAGRSVPGRSGLALSAAGEELAVVNDQNNLVTTYDMPDGTVTARFTDIPDVLRPQYSRLNELWLVSGSPGGQRIRVARGDELRDVTLGPLQGRAIESFRLSPDGVRIALVLRPQDQPTSERTPTAGQEPGEAGQDATASPSPSAQPTPSGEATLAIARIERDGNRVTIGGLRELPLSTKSQTQINRVADVGWVGAGQMVVLASATNTDQFSPYRLDQSAVNVEQIGQTDGWQSSQLAAFPSRESARLVVIGGNGGIWRFEDDFSWARVGDSATSAAYPG